ncbi:MAG: hypothetical protein P8X74_14640 [Reinekea sp.]
MTKNLAQLIRFWIQPFLSEVWPGFCRTESINHWFRLPDVDLNPLKESRIQV